MATAVTGWGQEDARRKSRAAGFDGHLVKPVNYAELMSRLVDTDTMPEDSTDLTSELNGKEDIPGS